jgi:hypothetical protein
MENKMEDAPDTQDDLKRYRDNILDPVLMLYRHLENAMDFGENPPKEIKFLMDEIFETVTRSLGSRNKPRGFRSRSLIIRSTSSGPQYNLMAC